MGKKCKRIAKTVKDKFMKKVKDVDDATVGALERRGLWRFANAIVQKKQQKPMVLNAQTLERLSRTDPVTWSILRTIKSRLNSKPWDIVPDVEKQEKELDRWEEYVVDSLDPYGSDDEPFKSSILDNDVFKLVSKKVDSILSDETKVDPDKIKVIRWIFKVAKKRIQYKADTHCESVREIFNRPNNSAETSLRALQELVVNDLLIYDAGVIVKNYSQAGNLAELYTVPGHEIKVYRNEDRTTPQPPEPAYVWEDQGIMRAEFTNAELIYIMANPTQTGYGISPLEVAAYVITASLFADQYNIDYFKNSNVPPGIMDLGKDITEEQRMLFQTLWDNEVQGRAGGLHRMLFMAGSDGAKFIPLQNLSNRDMQMMEYLKWTVSIKCACYGVSPQDIGFTQDFRGMGSGGVSDNQKELSSARGIDSIAQLLEQYYNAEIVKSEFEFNDCKFQWTEKDDSDDAQEASVDINDINAGVITRNERRNKLGLKPIQGGDIPAVMVTGGLFPVEKLDEQEDMEREAATAEQPQEEGIPQAGTEQEQVPGQDAPFGTEQQQPEEPADGEPTDQGTDETQPPTDEQKVMKSKLRVVVNKKKRPGEQKKMLDSTVRKLRDSGISAELYIGFDDKKV